MTKTSFKTFIQEKLDGRSGQSLNSREAANMIFEHALNAYESGAMLWRGSKNYPTDANAVYVQPGNYERVATTLYNAVNLMTSNFDSWSAYPKRNRSIMTGTSKTIAMNYMKDDFSNLWRVLPFDNAKLGVCPKDDFWISLKPGLRRFHIEEVQDIEAILGVMYASITGKEFGVQKNVEELRSNLNEIDEAIKLNGVEKYLRGDDDTLSDTDSKLKITFFNESYNLLLQALKDENKTIWQLLEECMDPTLNGFKITNTKTLNIGITNREIWTSGDCILVRWSDWDAVDDEIRKLWK